MQISDYGNELTSINNNKQKGGIYMEPVTLFDIAKTLLPDEVSPHDAIKEIKATMELRDGSEVSAIFSGTNAWSDAVSDFEFAQTSPLVASCVVTEIRLEGIRIRMKHQL